MGWKQGISMRSTDGAFAGSMPVDATIAENGKNSCWHVHSEGGTYPYMMGESLIYSKGLVRSWNPIENIADAWLIDKHHPETDNYTDILWESLDGLPLWQYSEEEAAMKMCKAALYAVGIDVDR